MGLDTVELLYTIEKHFGISIADQEAEKIFTVGDFQQLVWEHMQRDPSRMQLSRDKINEDIVHIIARFAGFSEEEITPDKSITSDLGLD